MLENQIAYPVIKNILSQYAFDSPLLERTTTSVEKPTRKNSWIKQQVPECSYRHLRLLLFALITLVAYRVVQSDIFPCRSHCSPIKNILLENIFGGRGRSRTAVQETFSFLHTTIKLFILTFGKGHSRLCDNILRIQYLRFFSRTHSQ
jgi:hypothetical protein